MLANSETISGTPNYIAPEVLREEKLNYTIDNFAIGVIIYFMYIWSVLG
jgi:serine/threonine protein kinase